VDLEIFLAFPALIAAFRSAMDYAKVGGRSGFRFAPVEYMGPAMTFQHGMLELLDLWEEAGRFLGFTFSWSMV